ncbi:hypothetical protein Agabi119p4_11068 [Agaricus bisporus var. burnettii]|uniref:C2H2-type domain-containing protein n=1 Tax=Agaricus bisporus var. burnettii TaxID=192524 RepID=A0A8H7EVY6_AGABI|nr:hypothetical protein Agabi119p4_11068 [Agaricus bisporus var. burnettii]
MNAEVFSFSCPFVGCEKWVKSKRGLKQHINRIHTARNREPPSEQESDTNLNEIEDEGLGNCAAHWSYDNDSESEPGSMNFQAEDAVSFVPGSLGPSHHGSPEMSFSPVGFEELGNEGMPSTYGFNLILTTKQYQDRLSPYARADRTPMTSADTPLAEVEDEPPSRLERVHHPFLTGTPCDAGGRFLLPNESPPEPVKRQHHDWFPFTDKSQFETAEFLYSSEEMSAGKIDKLMSLWAARDGESPFVNHKHLYATIDAIPYGEVRWKSATITYKGGLNMPDPESEGPTRPTWMEAEYPVHYRDPLAVVEKLIGNPDFAEEFDLSPYHEYFDSKHRFRHFMSGDWAWRQADEISKDPCTHNAMFVPIILGSDKTTVSVGTGDNSYWPIYLSIGNIHNNTRRSRRGGVVLIGFLHDVKTDAQYRNTVAFRKFKRQLLHSSIRHILSSLKPAMTIPRVVKCGDGHFRKVILGLGPYIADYPEQCALACIVQNWCTRCLALPSLGLNAPQGQPTIPRTVEHTVALVKYFELGTLWEEYGLIGDVVPFTEYFPRASIYENLSPDILHQLIKGTFKDHLVDWTEKYIYSNADSPRQAKTILDDIDHRIAIAPPFTGLRNFPTGREFNQWTGDDSKALMKVYLPALSGYVPSEIIRTFRAFLEFCYIVRREVIDTDALEDLRDALYRFHKYREVFVTAGIRRENSTPPRQHAMDHYPFLIRAFGAPNGLCSSITESKHIAAVKEPYRRSNRHKALDQILQVNRRSDALAAARVYFEKLGMLNKPSQQSDQQKGNNMLQQRGEEGDSDGEENDVPQTHIGTRSMSGRVTLAKRTSAYKVPLASIATKFSREKFSQHLHSYLTNHYGDVPLDQCMRLQITTFPSVVATFYAPSDVSCFDGMKKERIRSLDSWRGVD